jgi:hypothetical protein
MFETAGYLKMVEPMFSGSLLYSPQKIHDTETAIN